MIENFEFYLNNGMVKKSSPNEESANAIMEKATARLKYVREQNITKETAPFVFENIYETLRESCQALMELKGYKPYSHEAHVAFLNEYYNFPTQFIETFNRFRILRNKLVYGAAQISPESCKDALGFAVSFLPKVKQSFDADKKLKG